MPLLSVVSDIAEIFKNRDTNLVSLSSQPQNFNFCNFFFKTSGTILSPVKPGIFSFHTHTPDTTVYSYLLFRQHPFYEK